MPKHTFKSLLCPTETVTAEQLETDRQLLDFGRTIQHLNRRGFLSALAGGAALAALAGGQPAEAQAAAVPITDVLNFALNLEYLEANFYLMASTGSGLSAADMGSGGVAAVNGPKVTLTGNTLAVCQALAADEVHHVELLRATITSLGATPIPQPLINFGAKGNITTQMQFIAATRQFTALGGSAYIGSSILLVSNPSVLSTASQILGTEGQHAGAVGYLAVTQGVVSAQIDAQDVPPSQTNYFTLAPTTALSPSRNTSQVLGVAYGISTPTTTTPSAGTSMGGFFPNGFNGNIKTT